MVQTGAARSFTVGRTEVIALEDGILQLPLSLFPGATEDPAIGPGPFPAAINCHLIRRDGRLILVDAGCGPWRNEATGHLPASLALVGVEPAAIDTILMTHLHGDHAGGLVGHDGPAFPNADLWVAEDELAYWDDPGLPARSPEGRQATIATARKGLDAYRDRLRVFRFGDEVAPEITAVGLPGHTPGHTGFRVADGGEEMLLWADIVHVAAVQFPHPDWPIGFDVDGPAAVASRERAFAERAQDGILVAGAHLPFPGVGRVTRDGDRFGWAPVGD